MSGGKIRHVHIADEDVHDWRDRAACREMDPRLWEDPKTDPATHPAAVRAILICATCPVQEACLQDALTVPDFDTIRGGRIFGGHMAWTPETDVSTPIARGFAGRKVKPCGTAAGLRRHKRAGEVVCEPCRRAEALARAILRDRRELSRARQVAS